MFRKYSDFFWISFFPLVGLKWGITGYLGQEIGQLVLLIPMFFYIYFYFIHNFIQTRDNKLTVNQNIQIIHVDQQVRQENSHIFLVILYACYLCFNLLRAIDTNTQLNIINILGRIVTLICVILIGFIAQSHYRSFKDFKKLWDLLISSLGLYITLNVLGWLFGIVNSYVENLQLIRTGSLFDIFETRITFPFSANFQIFSIETGLTLLLLLARKRQQNTSLRVFDYILILLCIFVLLAVNSRNAFLALFVSTIFLVSKNKVKRRLLLPFLFGVLFLPILFSQIKISDIAQNIPFDFSFMTRRNDVYELLTLNNRIYIWQAFIEKFGIFEPIHIIGYGAFGQIRSGLSIVYQSYWQNPDLISLHNIYMQTLVDGGYIGLSMFLVLTIRSVSKNLDVFSRGRSEYLFPFITLIYLIMCSMIDISINFNQNITFLFFILSCFQASYVFPSNNYQGVNRKKTIITSERI